MPPKVKVTRDDIINASVDIVRECGVSALNARNIAARLHCSTQPVFSNFASMEELKKAVIDAADALYQVYTQKEVEQGKFPPYKASGMAYIRFATEEKELFKLLFMRDRSDETIPKETQLGNQMMDMIQSNIGVSQLNASLFHLEMWAYVHGIAVMIATGFFEIDWDLISRMLTDSYQGLKKRFEQENNG